MNQFLKTLENVNQGGATGWQQPLERIAQLVTRRGIVVIVSDFYSDLEDLFRGIRMLQSRGHDSILFQVLDPYEIEFPFDSTTLLEDAETEDKVLVVPDASRKHYLDLFSRHQEQLRKEAAAAGADWMLLRTDRPLDEALLRYLANQNINSAQNGILPIRVVEHNQPIFILDPGLYMLNLALTLGGSHPVYGLFPYQDGQIVVRESVQETAKIYYQCLVNFDPHGPYTIIAHCNYGYYAL